MKEISITSTQSMYKSTYKGNNALPQTLLHETTSKQSDTDKDPLSISVSLSSKLLNSWNSHSNTRILSDSYTHKDFISRPSTLRSISGFRQSSTQLKMVGSKNSWLDLKSLFDVQSAAALVWEEVKTGTKKGEENTQDEILRLRSWITAKVGVEPEKVMHPIFGELVKDIGYKRIYAISCEKLISIPCWEKQRIFRPERAKIIAQDITSKLKQGFPLTLPGVITIYEKRVESINEKEGTVESTQDITLNDIGLLDGQHRVGALNLLSEAGTLDVDAHVIMVEVFPVTTDEEIKRLFTEINTCQPVNVIDLPDVAEEGEKKTINDASEIIRNKYSDMFKASTNCRIPHMNIDNLRDELFKSNIVGRENIENSEQLVEWIMARNTYLSKKKDAYWKKVFKGRNFDAINKSLVKARERNFFIGMDRNWIDLDLDV